MSSLDSTVKVRQKYNIIRCVLQCSETCEDGVQMRVVVCQDDLGDISSDCEHLDRPSDSRMCNLGLCPRWNQGDWAPVNSSLRSLLVCFLCCWFV